MSVTGRRRADVLAVLRRTDTALSIASIADELGLHLNTVRFHLDALLEERRVERADDEPAKPGRPPHRFRAVRTMNPAGPRHYELLAEVLADALGRQPDPAAEAAALGRSLGARLGRPRRQAARDKPVAELIGLLDEYGFAPEPPADTTRIMLRHCPFLELAQAHPEVVCPLHLGFMQGAVQAWDTPIQVSALTPFAEPDGCATELVDDGRPVSGAVRIGGGRRRR